MKPCIRGLREFKKGCPENNSCACWIIEQVVDREGKKSIQSKCLDLWMYTMAWHANALLEGNQQATETFRNGMCEQGPDGNIQPKPGRFVIDMAGLPKPTNALDHLKHEAIADESKS